MGRLDPKFDTSWGVLGIRGAWLSSAGALALFTCSQPQPPQLSLILIFPILEITMIISRRIEPASDLVDDTRIRVEFNSDLVHRFTYQSRDDKGEIVRRREKQEIWKKEKSIGADTSSNVHRHRCLTGETPGELQAVKKIPKDSEHSNGVDFSKELEAIAKFSQKKVFMGIENVVIFILKLT